MFSPFILPPHPSAQAAAQEIVNKVHAYMRAHSESELHTCGKMFGVLVVQDPQDAPRTSYLAAFSAQLDGSYHHEGFVPPVYEMPQAPIGNSKEESRRLQQLIFANYRFLNRQGAQRNALEIFANEKPIIPAEEWFHKSPKQVSTLPPSGAGECCAPKLLQYAFLHHLEPIALAEFWIGAPPRNELRQEGCFYPPCSGKCVPILRHMLDGIPIDPLPITQQAEELCRAIEVIYEDEYLIVVNKPAGLLSVPGKNGGTSLAEFMSQQRNGAFIQPVHRLDQDTSGLLVLAKTADIYKTLQAYFQRRDILKRYEAVIQSEESKEIPKEGMIELPLLPNPYDRPRQMVDYTHGKTAITAYKIREQRPGGLYLVDFYPQTGRTHQLRVHAAHPDGLHAPIVGDRLYGRSGERLMLHAAEIRFMHPITREEMHFCIPSHF